MQSNHGANLFELSKKSGYTIEEFKDFSSNINPFGTSKKAIDILSRNLNKVSIYPDPEYIELKESISDYCKCNKKNILLGSGASSFIHSFIKILSPVNSLLIYPAYSEYENELKKVNSNIYKIFLNKEHDFKINIDDIIECVNKKNMDTLILCNPNNPTGTILSKEQIKSILDNTNVNLIVDETYIEFTDKNVYSCTNLCDYYTKIFVIRGTSKFFACPGIRLGYALTSNKQIIDKFEKEHNILWDINIFADIMGQVMFRDYDFQKDVYEKISKQRDYVFKELSKINLFDVYKSYGNFMLIRINSASVKSHNIYEYLLKRNFIIRDCANFEGLGDNYFRICVLEEKDNISLIDNIKDFVKETLW